MLLRLIHFLLLLLRNINKHFLCYEHFDLCLELGIFLPELLVLVAVSGVLVFVILDLFPQLYFLLSHLFLHLLLLAYGLI
jgi:hypothetical protein